MDSSETASAWLGKQLFLWPLHPESGNFYASVCRVSLLLLCLRAGSRLEQLWEPAAGAMGHNSGCRGMVPEDDRAREQNSPHPGDPHAGISETPPSSITRSARRRRFAHVSKGKVLGPLFVENNTIVISLALLTSCGGLPQWGRTTRALGCRLFLPY